MKTITKFYFSLLDFFPMLALLACGSVAFAQVPIPPVTPADSAAKAAALAAQGPPPAGAVDQMVAFDSGSRWHLTVNAVPKFGLVITGASFQKSPTSPFLYVLFDGRLGEIFVPYHLGEPRYKDIEDFNWPALPLPQAKFPPPRQIIGGGKVYARSGATIWRGSPPHSKWRSFIMTTLPGSATARKLSIFR